MKLLNLCCGSVRPASTEDVQWINVDDLRHCLPLGTPERENLDRETNYRDRNVVCEGLTPEMEQCDGILMSHCVEHWTCSVAAVVMSDCHRALKPGGVLLVSVPDASYFRKVHHEDTAENAERLFGEPIFAGDGETTFFGYGLWNRHHKAILGEDALWAYFVRAGFTRGTVRLNMREPDFMEPLASMVPLLNRLPFSLVMAAQKE